MKLLKITLTILFAAFIGYVAEAQIKVGDNPLTIDDGSILELESINKAFVLPRMTTAQRDQIPSPLKSAMIFNTTENCIQINVGIPSAPDWHCLTYSGTDEDNQIITSFEFDSLTNNITIELEDGGGAKVLNLDALDHDEQKLSLNGNVLTLENGGQVNLAPYLDNKDQIITAFYLDSDPNSPRFNNIVYRLAGDSINQEHFVDLNFLDVANTDKQNLTSATIDNNILTIEIERGDSVTVDLSQYVNDDQEIEEFQIINDILYLTLEDGGGQVEVDLSKYLNTDNQQISGSIQDIAGKPHIIIDLVSGGTATIDISSFDNDGTDDQKISGTLDNNILTIDIEGDEPDEDIVVNLNPYLDNTDAQGIEQFTLVDSILTLQLENSTDVIEINLSSFNNTGTDNQTLSFDNITNDLSISNGNTVNLTDINTDNQTVTKFELDGNNLVIELERGNEISVPLDIFNNAGSDNQNLESAYMVGNVLHIEIQNGQNVDVNLSQFMDDTDTDSQNISTFELQGK